MCCAIVALDVVFAAPARSNDKSDSCTRCSRRARRVSRAGWRRSRRLPSPTAAPSCRRRCAGPRNRGRRCRAAWQSFATRVMPQIGKFRFRAIDCTESLRVRTCVEADRRLSARNSYRYLPDAGEISLSVITGGKRELPHERARHHDVAGSDAAAELGQLAR